MASTTTTTGTGTGTVTGTAVMNHNTNRCSSCNTDLSAFPISTSNIILCPHCNSYLPSNPNPNSSQSTTIPSFIDPFTPSTTIDSSITASDDNFRLDSPYLQRLIHHLRHSNPNPNSTQLSRHLPTSKSAIEAIPTVTITSEFLDIDPIVLCAVCKDQFVVNDETKQLPCKHIYHPDCILPWLSQHNSCPVCRFQMPKEPVSGGVKVRRRSRSRVFGFGNLMEDVDDEAMLGIGFSNLHQQYLQSEIDPNVMFPFSRIGQTVNVDVLPDSELENGVANVTSWPDWSLSREFVDGVQNGLNRESNGWLDAEDDDDDDVEML